MSREGRLGKMEHLSTAREVAASTVYNKKNLDQRVLGKFYTPESIANNLIDQIITHFSSSQKSEITICEPFAGDGRLVSLLLSKLSEVDLFKRLNKVNIIFFEIDHEAISKLENLKHKLRNQFLDKVSIDLFKKDSLISSEIAALRGKVDIVITNPPWELLKPDAREMRNMSLDQIDSYTKSLKDYDSKLAKLLPSSQPKKKFAGWGTNLSRCGLEQSLNLLSSDGVLGIIIPSSIFSDQMSEKLRTKIFSEVSLMNINFYPATSRVFKGVDQDFVSCVCLNRVSHETVNYELSVYDKGLKRRLVESIHLDHSFLRKNEYQIPLEHGRELVAILKKVASCTKFVHLESTNDEFAIYAGREMDETGFKSKLKTEGLRFLKGRSVSRYGYSSDKAMYVSPELKSVYQSVDHFRLVWRDVARKSQVRRMHAMVIDPDILTGNSLHVIYSKSKNKRYLKALSVIFNSMVFESQVRSKLSTNHISLGVVRSCYLPILNNEKIELLSSFYDVEFKTIEVLTEIEEMVSELYGLTSCQLVFLAQSFFPSDEVTKSLTSGAACITRSYDD